MSKFFKSTREHFSKSRELHREGMRKLAEKDPALYGKIQAQKARFRGITHNIAATTLGGAADILAGVIPNAEAKRAQAGSDAELSRINDINGRSLGTSQSLSSGYGGVVKTDADSGGRM